MGTRSEDKVILTISIIGFFLLGISFLIMPLDMYNKNINSSTINIISGLCFWLALIVGCVTQIILTMRVKKYSSGSANGLNEKKHIGIISFFQNKCAAIADLVFLISIVGCIASFVLTESTGYVCYVFLALIIFSFSMHCILNGKNFYYVNNN